MVFEVIESATPGCRAMTSQGGGGRIAGGVVRVALLLFVIVGETNCAQRHHTNIHTPEAHGANITVKRHYHNHHNHHNHNKDSARTFNSPQLTKRDKDYLGKLEDALQGKKGRMLYTNSWAVQLNPAEVAQADRIAEKHGFENLGQVRI